MYMDDYKRWAGMQLEDQELTAELALIEGKEEEIKERFAVALKFGTAGLPKLPCGSPILFTLHSYTPHFLTPVRPLPLGGVCFLWQVHKKVGCCM